MNKRMLIAVLVIALILTSCSRIDTAQSPTREPLTSDITSQAEWVSHAKTVNELMWESNLVVMARVSGAPVTRVLRHELPVWDENNKIVGSTVSETLVSDTVFEIIKTYHGKSRLNITVMQTGGFDPTISKSVEEIADDPLYKVGEEYILFLVDISGDKVHAPDRELYRTVNPFGRYKVDGEKVFSYGQNPTSDTLSFVSTASELESQIEQTIGAMTVEYLKNKLGQLGVPVNQIVVLQDSPLEIEVTIQSLSTNEKFAPDDFVNIHMVVRESVFASDKGYPINGLSKIVVNMEGKQINKGWIKIEPESMYRRLAPSQLTETSTANLLNKKLAEYGMSKINGKILALDESQALDLYLPNLSKEETNLTMLSIKDSLGILTEDMNSQGAGISFVKLRITNESGETLLNFLSDWQFSTEGWWVADGINIDSWLPSIPAPVP